MTLEKWGDSEEGLDSFVTSRLPILSPVSFVPDVLNALKISLLRGPIRRHFSQSELIPLLADDAWFGGDGALLVVPRFLIGMESELIMSALRGIADSRRLNSWVKLLMIFDSAIAVHFCFTLAPSALHPASFCQFILIIFLLGRWRHSIYLI